MNKQTDVENIVLKKTPLGGIKPSTPTSTPKKTTNFVPIDPPITMDDFRQVNERTEKAISGYDSMRRRSYSKAKKFWK